MKEFKSYIDTYTIKKTKSDIKKVQIKCSRDSYNYIQEFYGDDIEVFESFFLLLLNNSNNTVGYVKISQGGITGTMVDVKIIAKYCLDTLATSCIIAHNHPSGKLVPSRADKDVTKKIKDALKLIDTTVLDHIILTPDNGYYSFADDGIL